MLVLRPFIIFPIFLSLYGLAFQSYGAGGYYFPLLLMIPWVPGSYSVLFISYYMTSKEEKRAGHLPHLFYLYSNS